MSNCSVCPHACMLVEGKLGICGARTLRGGKVESCSFGQATSLSLDPIEKKPLARFHPGAMILSYGSYGCNMHCVFCQNSDISMRTADSSRGARFISPEQLVAHAVSLRSSGNIGIAFTYNEPFIAPEYLMDTALRAHDEGLLTAAVTNGYVSADTWDAALGLIDAYNIDLKCFTEEGYRTLGAPGGLSVVKRSIESAVATGAHVEVTTLVVPGLSDDEVLFEAECAWLSSIDVSIPLHITRFFPAYRMLDVLPTDVATMKHLRAIAERSLEFVYLGNV